MKTQNTENEKQLAACGIVWDIDDDSLAHQDLPATVLLETTDAEHAADELSDRFGYCVSSLLVLPLSELPEVERTALTTQ